MNRLRNHLIVAAVLTVLAAPASAQDVVSGINGKIAFNRDSTKGRDIWLMNPDGTGQTQLTKNQLNTSARWSPDGTKIAFGKGPDGGFTSDIYVMNSDGTGVTNLTNEPTHFNVSPAWSPDSTRIAFDSGRDLSRA
jgi:TolB protein